MHGTCRCPWVSQCHGTNSLRRCSLPLYVSSDRCCLARRIPGVGQNLWEKGGCRVAAGCRAPLVRLTAVGWGGSRPPLPRGRKQEPRGLPQSPAAGTLCLHQNQRSCPTRHRRPCSVSPVCKVRRGECGPPLVGGQPPLLAPLLRCPKREAAATRAPGLSSSFCRESAVHPSSGTGPGSGSQCPAVVYARNKGSSWPVARCLRPEPRSQTRPWHDGCVGFAAAAASWGRRVLWASWQGFFLLRSGSLDGHPKVFL